MKPEPIGTVYEVYYADYDTNETFGIFKTAEGAEKCLGKIREEIQFLRSFDPDLRRVKYSDNKDLFDYADSDWWYRSLDDFKIYTHTLYE